MVEETKHKLKLLSEKQMSYEILTMRDEFQKLSRYVKPLTAITEITMIKKRAINSDNMNELP